MQENNNPLISDSLTNGRGADKHSTTVLKLFFDRSSFIVKLMEILGLIGIAIAIVRWSQNPHLDTPVILFIIMGVLYIFIRTCYLIRWYPRQGRDIGIEVHFKKSLVPTSYILFFTMLSFLTGLEIIFLILAVVMFSIVAFVNGILIGFHLKDRETMPINALSLKKYDEIPHPRKYSP